MFKKICPHCHQDSYSSAEHGEWVCPYCGKDITSVTAVPPNAPNKYVDGDEGDE